MKYITNVVTESDRCSPTNVPFIAVSTQKISNVDEKYIRDQERIIAREKKLNDKASRGNQKYW
jgi:hypothetical protein